MYKRHTIIKLKDDKSNYKEVIKSYEEKIKFLLAKIEVPESLYEDMYQVGLMGVIEALNNYKGPYLAAKVERSILMNFERYIFANRTLTGYGLRNYRLDEFKILINCESADELAGIYFNYSEYNPQEKYAVSSITYDDDYTLANDSVRPTEDFAINNIDILKLYELLDTLNPRAKYCLINYYGLYGSTPKTLETIAKELGVTYQNIQDIINNAISKLRVKFDNYPKL